MEQFEQLGLGIHAKHSEDIAQKVEHFALAHIWRFGNGRHALSARETTEYLALARA